MRAGRLQRKRAGRVAGQTLVEVLISVMIIAGGVVATVNGYIFASARAEWSAHSLAAQSLAIQGQEQVRAAKWDPVDSPPIDEVVQGNFPRVGCILDLPVSGTNAVYATNVTTISLISTNPMLKAIQVDCIWPYLNRGSIRWYTNTVVTYRSPDQ